MNHVKVSWIAIHLENPNVGLSLGRLDQVLYELYRHDIDNGVMTVRDAVESGAEEKLSRLKSLLQEEGLFTRNASLHLNIAF